MSTRFYLLAVIAALSAAQARAADQPSGYLVVAADGAPVTTASGACVRTSQWSSEASYRHCDAPKVSQAKVIEALTKPIPVVVPAAVAESPSRAEPIRISM